MAKKMEDVDNFLDRSQVNAGERTGFGTNAFLG